MVKKSLKKVAHSIRKLPERKQYVEFLTAVLSVPVLLTVIILNVNNLKAKNAEPTPAPTPAVREIVITQPDTGKPVTVTTEPCKKGIGTISIDSPDEGDTVSDNPVHVDINYQPGEYCAVVWSYRINGGSWSNYDDTSVALYNLPKGPKQFDLRVKSVVTGEQKTLTRSFTYNGTSIVPTDTPASSSAH